MKISEYIAALESLKLEHGDLKVETQGYNSRAEAPLPKLAYCKLLNKRQRNECFWYDFEDEKYRGEKVVRV